jgi:drug/metabolite transporter (DMT)-like permease
MKMVSLKTLVVNLLLLTFTAEAFQSRWRIRQRSVVVGEKDKVPSHYVKCASSTSTSINVIGGTGDDVNIQLNDNNKSSLPTNDKSSQQGRALLLLVAFLYGTLNVTLRGVYATDGPPAPSVLSLVRQLLSLLAFIPILLASSSSRSRSKFASITSIEEEQLSTSLSGDNTEAGTDGTIIRPMWKSAIELAFWNFGAQGLVTLGLLVSPAARASFLTQTSVVMTPLISALAGETIGPSVWGGSVLALVGLYLISSSDTTMTVTSSTFLNRGDVMILLGALSWSMYIFRTSKLAKDYPELELQFAKTALLAMMYGSWFAFDAMSTLSTAAATDGLSMKALTPLWAGWNSSPFVWMLLIYSAVGPGAIADLLQQRGQKLVTSASESNVILCLESVFAAGCAYAFLGEVSSMREIAGGALIVFAAILASR